MRYANPWTLLGVLLLASCVGDTVDAEKHVAVLQPTSCNPATPNALVARPSDLKTTPRGHTLVAASTLRLVEAKYVAGPCADDIVKFVAGNARLGSGQIFVIWDNGKVQLHPSQGAVERHDIPVEKIESLPGYGLVMAEPVRLRRILAGKHASYLGLFRGKSDWAIARFDVINGKPSRNAEILIRSKLPIASIDFLGAPDTPEGSIGFVNRVGKGEAWLYAYNWNHSDLPQLRF